MQLLAIELEADSGEVLSAAKSLIAKHVCQFENLLNSVQETSHVSASTLNQNLREALRPFHDKLFSYLINSHPEGMLNVLNIRADLLVRTIILSLLTLNQESLE